MLLGREAEAARPLHRAAVEAVARFAEVEAELLTATAKAATGEGNPKAEGEAAPWKWAVLRSPDGDREGGKALV